MIKEITISHQLSDWAMHRHPYCITGLLTTQKRKKNKILSYKSIWNNTSYTNIVVFHVFTLIKMWCKELKIFLQFPHSRSSHFVIINHDMCLVLLLAFLWYCCLLADSCSLPTVVLFTSAHSPAPFSYSCLLYYCRLAFSRRETYFERFKDLNSIQPFYNISQLYL